MAIGRKDKRYIQQRGIEAVNGRPAGTGYPYFTLARIDSKEQFRPSLHYWVNQDNGLTPGPDYHPSRHETDRLVFIVEQMLAHGRQEYEGNLFTTQPGKPFKVFVIDPAWEEVAEILMRKYSSK